MMRGNRWVDSRIVDQTVTPRATIEFGSDEFHRLTSRLAAEGRQGSVSLRGDVVMVVDGEPVLVKGPANQ